MTYNRHVRNIWLACVGLALVAGIYVLHFDPVLSVAISLGSVLTIRASLSSILRLYVGYILVGLVIAPRLDGASTSDLGSIEVFASLWVLAACIGGSVSALMDRPRVPDQPGPSANRIGPALILASLGLVSAIVSIARGSFGVAGQYSTGISGGGYLGLLVQVGPPSAAGALILTLATKPRSWGTLVFPATLTLLEAISLAYSGFRGAGPIYIIAVFVCSLGASSEPRRGSIGLKAISGMVLFCICIALFALGVSVRQDAAAAAGVQGSALSLSNAVPTIVKRFDESVYLFHAQQFRNDAEARDAVSLVRQITAVVPRFLYPNKQTVDYGHAVSVSVYGAPSSTRNSSTVTTLGDLLINIGLPGGIVVLVIYVLLFDSVFRATRYSATASSLSIRVAVVTASLNLEAPAVLNIIGLLRVALTIVVVQWLVGWIFTPLGMSSRTQIRRAARSRERSVG